MDTLKVQKGEKTIEYENKYFHVYSQDADFGTFSKKHYVAKFGSKACLLILDQGNVLLARQYRFLIDRSVWEIPGGKVEDGEDASVSAVRECEEETGIRGSNIKPLIDYPQGLDAVSAHAFIYYTEEFGCIKEFTSNPKEVDKIQWVPLAQCIEMIRAGEIQDYFTMVAVLYYQHLVNSGEVR